jgi:hypothetical protein
LEKVAAGTTCGGRHVSAEIAVLTNALVALLSPLLPYVVKFGEGAAGQAGARFSEQVVERARVLWRRLRGDLAEPERIERAATEAAGDERFVAAVELEPPHTSVQQFPNDAHPRAIEGEVVEVIQPEEGRDDDPGR